MTAHPLDPMIFSPSHGGLVPFSTLQDSQQAQVDDAPLSRFDVWFIGTNYAWVALALLLAIALPSLVGIGLTRAFS